MDETEQLRVRINTLQAELEKANRSVKATERDLDEEKANTQRLNGTVRALREEARTFAKIKDSSPEFVELYAQKIAAGLPEKDAIEVTHRQLRVNAQKAAEAEAKAAEAARKAEEAKKIADAEAAKAEKKTK